MRKGDLWNQLDDSHVQICWSFCSFPPSLHCLCLPWLFVLSLRSKILSLYPFCTFSAPCHGNNQQNYFLVWEVEGMVCKVLIAFFLFLTRVTCGSYFCLQTPSHNFKGFVSQWTLPTCTRSSFMLPFPRSCLPHYPPSWFAISLLSTHTCKFLLTLWFHGFVLAFPYPFFAYIEWCYV